MTNNLKATKRDSKPSGDLNNLRSKGFIPAILYGGNNPSLKISIEEKLLSKVFSSDSFLSTVIDLNIDGQTEKVIPRDISYHVISDKPIHIDFMRVAKGSKIILQIPVIFKNNKDCPGLKSGGVLNIVRRKVELSCSAENIPENIVVDLANLEIGASIKISSIKLPENAQPTITGRDFVVATIAAPTIVKEPENLLRKFLQRELRVKPLLQQKVVKQLHLLKKVMRLRKMIKAKKPLVIKSLVVKKNKKKNK